VIEARNATAHEQIKQDSLSAIFAQTRRREDLRPRGAGWTLRLHEKGGKQHQHALPSRACRGAPHDIDAAGLVEDRKGWLFLTARGHNGTTLSDQPMAHPDAWRMIRRRAAAAGAAID
jgi:hypothetical protein